MVLTHSEFTGQLNVLLLHSSKSSVQLYPIHPGRQLDAPPSSVSLHPVVVMHAFTWMLQSHGLSQLVPQFTPSSHSVKHIFNLNYLIFYYQHYTEYFKNKTIAIIYIIFCEFL